LQLWKHSYNDLVLDVHNNQCFLFCKFSQYGEPSANWTKVSPRKTKCKNQHILRKKSHMLPYWDNELLFVVRSKYDSKKLILAYLTHSQILDRFSCGWLAIHLFEKNGKNLNPNNDCDIQ
jgi:hypothetical protein